MAFKQKTWTDRVAEFINRRLLTKEDGSTELVTVARSEGTVSTEGDGFTAKNMNDLEQRIADEFSELNNALSLDYSKASEDVQDLKTFLQKALEKLFSALKHLFNNGNGSDYWLACTAGSTYTSASVTGTLFCRGSWHGRGYCVTKEKHDVTNYSKLRIYVSNISSSSYGFGKFGLTGNGGTAGNSNNNYQMENFIKYVDLVTGWNEVDISDVTGEAYILVYAQGEIENNSTFFDIHATEVRLEN